MSPEQLGRWHRCPQDIPRGRLRLGHPSVKGTEHRDVTTPQLSPPLATSPTQSRAIGVNLGSLAEEPTQKPAGMQPKPLLCTAQPGAGFPSWRRFHGSQSHRAPGQPRQRGSHLSIPALLPSRLRGTRQNHLDFSCTSLLKSSTRALQSGPGPKLPSLQHHEQNFLPGIFFLQPQSCKPCNYSLTEFSE